MRPANAEVKQSFDGIDSRTDKVLRPIDTLPIEFLIPFQTFDTVLEMPF